MTSTITYVVIDGLMVRLTNDCVVVRIGKEWDAVKYLPLSTLHPDDAALMRAKTENQPLSFRLIEWKAREMRLLRNRDDGGAARDLFSL